MEIIEHQPMNAEAQSLLSQVLLLDGRLADAEKALIKARSIDSNLPSIFRNQARLLLKRNMCQEALDSAQLAYQKAPEDPENIFTLSACLGANHRDSEALELIEELLEAWPDHADALVNRALIQFRANNAQGAINDAKRAVLIKPNMVKAWALLSFFHHHSGDLMSAIEAATKAYEIEPGNKEYALNLGKLLSLAQENDKAIAVLRLSTELGPEDEHTWTNLAIAFQKAKNNHAARSAYENALVINPNSVVALSNLGALAIECEDWGLAVDYLGKAMAINPELPSVYGNLGIALTGLGEFEQALEVLDRAITLQPELAEAHNNLARTFKEMGKLDEAEASCKVAISIKPEFSEGHNNLGIILKLLGRLDEAEACYKTAVSLNPQYYEAYYNLGHNLKELDRFEEYEEVFRTLLRIDPDHYGLKAGVHLAILKFLKCEFKECQQYLMQTSSIQGKDSTNYRAERTYQEYLTRILQWRECEHLDRPSECIGRTFYIVGESHSLVSHCLEFTHLDRDYIGESRLITGCKQWHLGNRNSNHYKDQFERAFASIPRSSDVLLSIGEIDCRLDEGIIRHSKRHTEKDLAELVTDTTEGFLCYVEKVNLLHMHRIVVQGVPCPNINVGVYSDAEISELAEVITLFNYMLSSKATEKGFGFLDVHKLTNRGDGLSNRLWHIDDYHLSPAAVREAWRTFYRD